LFLIAVGDISWLSGYTAFEPVISSAGWALAAMVVSWPRRKISVETARIEQTGLFSKLLAVVIFTFCLALALVAGEPGQSLIRFSLAWVARLS